MKKNAPPIVTLKLKEVAATLRLSIKTTTDLLRDGTIPGVRCGKQWRIPATDLDTMLKGKSYAQRGTAGSRPAT